MRSNVLHSNAEKGRSAVDECRQDFFSRRIRSNGGIASFRYRSRSSGAARKSTPCAARFYRDCRCRASNKRGLRRCFGKRYGLRRLSPDAARRLFDCHDERGALSRPLQPGQNAHPFSSLRLPQVAPGLAHRPIAAAVSVAALRLIFTVRET